MLLGGLVIALQFKQVQTWAAQKTAKYLSEELKTKVEIKSLYLKPFKSIVLEGLYIQDLDKDTLLNAPKFIVDIAYFSPLAKQKIILNKIDLTDAKFYLKSYKDSSTNLSFIINYFSKGPKTKKKSAFEFSLQAISLRNLALKYKNYGVKDTLINGVNYDDVSITQLNTDISKLNLKDFLFQGQIDRLNFKEKSGFVLKELSAFTTIGDHEIVLTQMLLRTKSTTLTDYFSMKFKSYDDFDDVERKVDMEGHFKNAKIYSKDISFFTTELKKMDLMFEVSGVIKGKVNDLKTKNLIIKTGKATYVKGDFHVVGLPYLKDTFLDLNFDQVSTNKADITYILEKAIGKKTNNIPEVLNKFGNINVSGQFTGFTNDFIAYADFKTKLGRVKSDVNMKINKAGEPSYSGKIQAIDFNLGELLDEASIKRTSFTSNIDGKGIDINSLVEKLSAKATYFEYNDYKYTNIVVDGKINSRLFDGKLSVNDPNLKLDFDGKANFNAKLPEFNFLAKIKGANLNQLHFTKDTLHLDAELTTNFSGNSLDNIQGNLFLEQINLSNNTKSSVINAIHLKAEGLGNNRLLALTSDIGDANIKGDYDLATLPSAFKTIVKKYIPSYNTKIYPFKNQNFEFNFDLKNFDFVSNILLPRLKIPKRGAFNGKFDSFKKISTLTGYVESISYDDFTFTNLIVDENTLDKKLDITISLDKIGLRNSDLFAKNIIIQNTLAQDSLSFNVKLSDKDAINQLDLYGLIEFSKDSSSKLSLLPSDVIIDQQIWKIRDKVNIQLDSNRTIIDGFELSNDQQLIAVNGAISDSKEDQLEVVIRDFNMTSLSQLTKGFGIKLMGTMNGSANLSAILGTPEILSDIKIDKLQYNATKIGNLSIASSYNNFTEEIDVDAVLFNGTNKTMDIKGSVAIKSKTDNLNLNLILDRTELSIFEPAVNTIVTNLKGQISSDLKVTGKFNRPIINGNLSFLNAGATVKYLQTAYTINDQISIENSVIKANKMVVKDIFGNSAIATGTVDLANIENPMINFSVNAKNFMSLNTTFRDNPLYYGRAFSSGVFNFVGPTDDMSININAKTGQGTVFTIPLNGASSISANDFIVYIAKDSTANSKINENFFKGINMEFNLAVDEGAKVNILTQVGDLKGSGKAQLNLKITTLGDFEMKGDYIISEGNFDFSANNLINKPFQIRKGGTVRWTGNPSEATINLNAIYATRASLSPLYSAAGRVATDEQKNTKVNTEAEMLLKGSLLNPEIDFNLNFPNNTNIKTELQGYLDDKDNEAQQVINLVVRNSFNANSSSGVAIDNQSLISSGLELGFSKLNNIVSQSLGLKNLDLNIRSFSDVGFGYNFFNGRLKFNTSFANNTYNTNSLLGTNIFNTSFNDLSRNSELTYNIDKQGNFVLKAYNRPTNTDFFNLNNDNNVTGLGLAYAKEYDSFKEFIKTTFGRKKAKQKN